MLARSFNAHLYTAVSIYLLIVGMLVDLRAQVAEMDVDLDEFVRFGHAAVRTPPENQQP
jgi:hypothetical protein